jgi:transcriptional regulator
MSDAASLDTIQQRLDVIVHLLTAIVTKDMSRKDAVMTLTAAGLAPKEVAGVLGLTGNQVSVVLYGAKQAATKAKNLKQKAAAGGG